VVGDNFSSKTSQIGATSGNGVFASNLGEVSKRDPPPKVLFGFVMLIGVPFLLGLGVALVVCFNWIIPILASNSYLGEADNSSQLLLMALSLAGIGLICWFLMLFSLRRMIITNLFRRLIPAFEELCGIRDELTVYLRDIDRRTTGVVHCITSTQVVNHFILQQIRESLVYNLDELNKYFLEGSLLSFYKAHKLITGDLCFQDGVIAGSGGQHTIPLSEAKDTLQQLIYDLERGMRVLEGELESLRSSYRRSPTNQNHHRTAPESNEVFTA
jgi:hypothetical protein